MGESIERVKWKSSEPPVEGTLEATFNDLLFSRGFVLFCNYLFKGNKHKSRCCFWIRFSSNLSVFVEVFIFIVNNLIII